MQATGIPVGIHGVHVHRTGNCSAEEFSSAGGHLAGDAQHDILVEGGPHPGDLPNAHVQENGVLAMEVFKSNLSMDQMFDDDGSAVIIHAGDDATKRRHRATRVTASPAASWNGAEAGCGSLPAST